MKRGLALSLSLLPAACAGKVAPTSDLQVAPAPDGGSQGNLGADGSASPSPLASALATVDGRIDAIAQDDTALYFTAEDPSGGGSWLGMVAKDGASPRVRLTDIDSMFGDGITVDGTSVYWSTLFSGDVGPIMLAAGQIFWESWGGDKLSSVPASGGTQTVWTTVATQWSGPSWAIAPAPDGRGVYWADRSGAVSFANGPGATPQALSGPIPVPDQPLSYFALFLLADAGRVYLVEYQASYSGSQGSLILPIAR